MAGRLRRRQAAGRGRNVVNMVEVWLTAAADTEYEALPEIDRVAVAAAIGTIATGPAHPGFRDTHRLNIPAGPGGEPFLALRSGAGAPVVIYRRATSEERGDLVVVSLMKPRDYDAVLRAEDTLAAAPPGIRRIVDAVVAGTASTFNTGVPGETEAPKKVLVRV
jgi:hypothetical protein